MVRRQRVAAPLLAAAAVVSMVVLVTLLTAIGWPARTYRHFDFIGLWLGGRALLEGIDLYDPAAWLALYLREGSEGYALLPGGGYGYPLTTAVLAIPFALFPLSLAAPLWLVAQMTLSGAALWALMKALVPHTIRRDAPLLFALMFAAQPLWVTAYSGNVGGFLLAIVAACLALLLNGRTFAAGAVLGLLVMKPHLFLWAIPILLLASPQRRAIAGGALLSGSTLVGASFLLRPDWPSGWMATAFRLQGLNVSRANAWGLAPDDARWLGWIPVLLVLAAFAAWWWRGRPTLAELWSGALAFSLFASPYTWSYDQSVLVTAVAVVVGAVADRRPAQRMPVLVAIAAAWVALPWVLYVRAFRSGDEPAGAFVPLAMLAILVVAHRLRSAVPTG